VTSGTIVEMCNPGVNQLAFRQTSAAAEIRFAEMHCARNLLGSIYSLFFSPHRYAKEL